MNSKKINRKHLESCQVFECSECKSRFSLKTDVQRHLWSKHLKVKNFQCDLCGRLFATKQTLETHIKNHNRMIKYYVCTDCGARFKMEEHHENHQKYLHNKVNDNERLGKITIHESMDSSMANIMKDIDHKIEDIDIDLVLNEVCDDQIFDFINYPEIDHDYFILDLVAP